MSPTNLYRVPELVNTVLLSIRFTISELCQKFASGSPLQIKTKQKKKEVFRVIVAMRLSCAPPPPLHRHTESKKHKSCCYSIEAVDSNEAAGYVVKDCHFSSYNLLLVGTHNYTVKSESALKELKYLGLM